MKKTFFLMAALLFAEGAEVMAQGQEAKVDSFIEREIVQLKKDCQYDETKKPSEAKAIHQLTIGWDIWDSSGFAYGDYRYWNPRELTFNHVKAGETDSGATVSIKIHGSSAEAVEDLFKSVAAYMMLCSHQPEAVFLGREGNALHPGDYAIKVDSSVMAFSRANVSFFISCPGQGQGIDGSSRLFGLFDELCVSQAREGEIDGKGTAIVFNDMKVELAANLDVKFGDEEEIGQKLGSMPFEEARRLWRQRTWELSASPDKNAYELMAWLRALPAPEDAGLAGTLEHIEANSKDPRLHALAAQLRGKWLAALSTSRMIMERDLGYALGKGNPLLRKRAAAALGESCSLEALPILLKELAACPGDQDLVKAVGRAIGAGTMDGPLDEGRSAEIEKAASDFLKALEDLRKAVRQ